MSACRQSDADRSAAMSDRAGQWSVGAGYLSSFVAVETGVGLRSCPWLVDVPPGRRINITVPSPSGRWVAGGGAAVTSGCQWTIVVGEGNLTTHLSGCVAAAETADQRRRHRVVYTSHRRGTAVTVYLSPTTTTRPLRSHLLLYFQGAPTITTRHRASTSMYSLTFCVRVMSPERHQWKPAVQAAAVMLRTPPSPAGH